VIEHILHYHNRLHQFVCSGTKQMKIITSLWDYNSVFGSPSACTFLSRSAEILRESIKPAPLSSMNHIDKDIRLVYTSTGPAYKSINAIHDAECPHRRVRNVYYTHGFAEILKAEVLVHSARVKSFLPRLTMRALEAGNPLASLYPGKVACWWPILEDMFTSPVVSSLMTSLKAELVQHGEYESLSVDATMRATLSILGQPHPRSSGEQSAFPAKDRLTRILTVRGRTNAVLAMSPMPRENVDAYTQVVSDSIPPGVHGQVRFLATDDPSPSMWTGLKSALPNLQVLVLDPVHLAMVLRS